MLKKLALGSLICLLIIAGVGAALFLHALRDRVEGEFFVRNGVRIHYTIEGQGEPVLLIHGFAANADMNWRKPGIHAALANHYKVIALDNRGHGLSDKPHAREDYGVAFVEDAIGLLDHLHIEKAHVVGYSMGSFITTKLVTMYPDRVATVAPCGAGWEAPEMRSARPDILSLLAESLEAGKGFTPLIEMLDKDGQVGPLRRRFLNFTLSYVNDQQALAAVSRSLEDLQVTEEELRNISVPMLQIVGGDDPLRIGVENMAAIVPNHQKLVIEGTGHITALQAPSFREELLNFLKAHPMDTQEAAVKEAA